MYLHIWLCTKKTLCTKTKHLITFVHFLFFKICIWAITEILNMSMHDEKNRNWYFAIFYLISIEIQEDHRYDTAIFAFDFLDLLCIIIYFTMESYISSTNLVLLAKTFCVHIIFERWKSRLEWRKMVRALFIVFHYCSRKEAGKIGWVEWAERLFCYIFLLFVLFWWRSNQ